jgi:hypothetical protein
VEREYAKREDETMGRGVKQVLVDLKPHPDGLILFANGRTHVALDDLHVEPRASRISYSTGPSSSSDMGASLQSARGIRCGRAAE